MSEGQRATSLNGLAKVIARRLKAIRDIAAAKSEDDPPAGELARQFQTMCKRAHIIQRPNLNCGDAVARYQAGA
jgi:hypothetical protein